MVHDGEQNLSVVISIHGQATPSDGEWKEYVDACQAAGDRHRGDVDRLRCLSVSAGGGPTASQRSRVAEALRGRVVRVAIVTHSSLVRGMVTALAWFNPATRAFAPSKLAQALQHLELPPSTVRLVRLQLKTSATAMPDAALVIDSALAS